jgi:hypothetical protein
VSALLAGGIGIIAVVKLKEPRAGTGTAAEAALAAPRPAADYGMLRE